MAKIFLITGLGNPGKKYENTRHNVGFRVIGEFAKENNFPVFTFSRKFNVLISEDLFNGKKIILIKPQTFMNNSGTAISKIIRQHKIKTENLLVVHDDIDLPLGVIMIVKNRGTAGHKGVESIIRSLGNKNFIRLRVGIRQKTENRKQKTKNKKQKIKKVERFVLQKFTKEEGKIIEEIIKKGAAGIKMALVEGVEKAMNTINRKQ